MTHVIRVLQREHDRQRELLRLMDDMLTEMTSGGDPDYHLLADIADYLTGYPDQVHHPKEDFIYRKLRKRDRRSTEGPGNLVREHEDLSALTTSFAAAVGEGRKNPGNWRSRIEHDMRRLVDSYRHHLEMEEKHFFPEALDKLTRSDWSDITFAISEQVDPLFDEATTRFERLRERIVRLAAGNAPGVEGSEPSPSSLPDIGQVTTIEAFNEAAAAVSSRVRLEVQKQGGYALAGSAGPLLIPDCDEKAAVWCAYCYLAGTLVSMKRLD